MKRLLALILAMAMTFSVVMPSVAAAAETSGVSSAVSEDGSLSVLEAQESSSAADKSSENAEKEASEEEASVEKSSEKESSSETTEPSATDEEHSSEKEETSPEKEPSEGEKQDKEKNAPVESVQFEPEESSVREEDSEQEASAQETLAEALESKPEEFKTVKGSLKGVDGTKYTVTLVYGENAEIPDGAKLSLVELNTELTEEEKKLKENKDRPYDTEKFLSEKALEQETFDLHQGLKVQEKDYVLFTKFLDISLEKNGKTIQPKAPVSVTVETDAVEEGASDALELAFYDKEATKKWKEKREKLVKEQEEKIKSGKLKREDAKRYKEKIFTPLELANETEKKKGARVTFMTEEIARLGISGVAKELKSWKVKDNTVSVYGPRSLKAKVNTESMKTREAGVEKMRAFSVETSEKTAPDYDVTYWVGTQAQGAEPEGLAAQAEKSAVDAGVVVSELKNSKAKKELIGTEGTAAPVAIQAGDKIGVAYDTGLREKTVESDKVTLEGMLPKNADVTASDMLWRYSKPEDVKEDVQQGEAETLAAYDITIKSRNQEFQPDEGESVGVSISGVKVSDKEKVEIWHVRDDGSVEVIRDFKVKGDTVSFKAEGFSVYMVVQYTVDFHYGEGDFDFSIIGGNTISMKELVARLHVVEVQDQAALDAVLAELHPAAEKEKAIIEDEDETETVPEKSAPTKPVQWPEEIERFVANIASVKWSNDDVARVTKVKQQTTVGDLVDSLGLVNQFSAEMTDSQIEAAMNVVLARGDWAFISTQPFLTEEKLTITMQNGDVYEIGVTDAYVRANTTVRNPSVKIKTAGKYLNASGNLVGDESARIPSNLNFTVKANGTASVAGKAVNTAGTFYYIPDQLEYNGEWYQVTDIHVLTPAAINGRHVIFDDDLPAHMLGATTEALPDIIDRLTAQMLVDAGIVTAAEVSAAGYSSDQKLEDDQVAALVNGSSTDYEVGTHKESRNLFDLFKQAQYDVETNKVTISMKYFQKMKKDVPLDFIFVYDDSGTMASAATNAGSFGYTYSASQSVWCRIVLQVILQGIMDWSEDNRDKSDQGYDIRMSPIAFADKAYYEKAFYDNYVDAKTSLGRIYTSGGTAHVNALNGCIDLAKLSMSQQSTRTHEQRNPIVVYLSDFHSNANSRAAKKAANELRSLKNTATGEKVHVYTIHMFERNFRYDRNIASDSDSMFITGDISEMLGVFDTITKDAIGYYVAKNIAVQDTVSSNLAGMAQSMTVSTANGAVTKSGNTSNWVISSGTRLPAGVVYTQTIEIQMKDDVVFSPSMVSNESARVIKNEEDDDGNVNPVIVNQIDNQPKPKGELRMILGLLDENGGQTSNVITGADFELYKDGTKIWTGTTATVSTAGGTKAGEIAIPASVAPFAPEETYILKQTSTNEGIAIMPEPGTWTLTVGTDYRITSTAGGEKSPAMSVSNGEFHIWNKAKANTMTALAPVVIKKMWDGYTPASGDSISFTVLGNDGHGGTVELPAYATKNRTAEGFDEQNTVTTLKASDKDINNTPWTKIVYVPATSGEGAAKLTFFDTETGKYTNGYTVREDGVTVSAPDGEWTKSIDSTGTVPGEDYTYYTYEGQEGIFDVTASSWKKYNLYLDFVGTSLSSSVYGQTGYSDSYMQRVLNGINAFDIVLSYIEAGESKTANLHIEFSALNFGLGKSVTIHGVDIPSLWSSLSANKITGKKTTGENVIIHDASKGTSYLEEWDSWSNYTSISREDTFNKNVKSQTLKREEHVTATPHTATSLAKQILQVTNTFSPRYTIRFGTQWVDESEDSASTANAIDAVTYTILKDGQPYGDPITVGKGDTLAYPATPGSIRVPAGTYTIRQTSYTLANGEVVSTAAPEGGQADTYQFAAYEVTNDKDANSGGSYAVTVGSGTTAPVELKFTNKRKQFTANVHTVWDPDHEYYDGEINYKLRYTILTNDGGTYKLTNHTVPGVNNDSNGWRSSHNHIPRYGINGVETVCDVDPDALDALVAFYETDTGSVIDASGNLDFTITNTERRVTFSVRKDWLDAEGQEIPEADRKPVTIEIWGIEKKAGGDATGQGVLPPSALRLRPENYPEPFKSKLWNNVNQDAPLTAVKPNPNGFFEWDGIWYAIETTFTTNANQFQNKNVVGTGRVLPFSGRVIDSSFYDINQNGDQLVMKQDAPLDVKGFQMGDVVIYNNKYRILRESPGQYANVSTLVDLGWGDIEASSGSGNTQAEYPHSTQFQVDALITKEHAKQIDADTKRVKADGVTAEYTITANDGWTKSFELPARYVYFAREVKVGTLPLENEDNTENLENLAMFSPYYDYDQGAVTVAISNQAPIARVRTNNGEWHYFDTLLTVHAENYPEHQGAFNYANTLSGNVEIELLRRTNPFYTMKSGFTFDTPTSVTLRTTQDGTWNPGDTKFSSTIKRGFTGQSLIGIDKGTSFTLEKIILDGDKNDFYSTDNGGLIYVNGSTLNIRDGAMLQNSKVSNDYGKGGAVYASGSSMVNMTGGLVQYCESNQEGGGIKLDEGVLKVNGTAKIENCKANHGGGIHVNYTTTTISGNAEIKDCTVNGYGGGIYVHGRELDDSPLTTITDNVKFTNCYAGWDGTGYNADGAGGGINLGFKGKVLVSGSVSITGCKATRGGGVNIENSWDRAPCTGTITGTVTISGCKANGNGGGVNVENETTFTLSGGTIIDNEAKANGGGVYTESTISFTSGTIQNNTAGNDGGGIYLVEGSALELSGSPSFGTNGNQAGTGDDAKRQDIFIAGYLGTIGGDGDNKDDPKLANSLIVTGALNVEKGSIWVGAEVKENEEKNHWDSLKQFAKFADALMTGEGDNRKIDSSKLSASDVEKIYAAFRNATTTEEYHGMTGDGQTGGIQCIYWEGVQGSQKVILKKVGETSENSTSNYYKPLEGAQFTIYKGDAVYKLKNGDELKNLPSSGTSATGIIWIGELPYGTYYLEETEPPTKTNESGERIYGGNKDKWFCLIVDETGVWMSKKGYKDMESYGNTPNKGKDAAKADADAVKEAALS